jgi:hypothetical protein
LSATPITRDRRREQQQCRPMLAIQDLDLGGISDCLSHFAVSMLRQSAPMYLSMSGKLFSRFSQAAPNQRKSNGICRLGCVRESLSTTLAGPIFGALDLFGLREVKGRGNVNGSGRERPLHTASCGRLLLTGCYPGGSRVLESLCDAPNRCFLTSTNCWSCR